MEGYNSSFWWVFKKTGYFFSYRRRYFVGNNKKESYKSKGESYKKNIHIFIWFSPKNHKEKSYKSRHSLYNEIIKEEYIPKSEKWKYL